MLTVWNVDPRIHWIPVLGMPVLGILALLLSGLDKVTAVVTPLLMVATVFAVLRQTGVVGVEVMLPCLLMVTGFLMLVSHLAPIPTPSWIVNGHHRQR